MMRDNGFNRREQSDRGFTLVELLVVISIIGILVALITPAIFNAVKRAKIAQQKIEITAMAQAFEQYRIDYGSYPPDFAGNAADDANQVNTHLNRNFRSRDASSDAIAAPNGLHPSEALVFWLKGFSPDPRHPLTGQNKAARFEFDKARIGVGEGPNGFDVYYPKGDKSKTPYLYYAAIGSNPTSCYDDTSQAIRDFNNTNPAKPLCMPAWVYRSAGPDGNEGTDDDLKEYAGAGKYQIISAGLDGLYVPTGKHFLHANYKTYCNAVIGNPAKSIPFNRIGLSKAERDNLSSFCEEGTFADAVDD